MSSSSADLNPDLEKQPTLINHDPTFGEQAHRQDSTVSNFRFDRDHIYINDNPIPKDDFLYAFGGTFQVGSQAISKNFREYANPVPAGLAAFSCTTITLGLVNMHARHVLEPNVLVGACLTTSGLVELIVGIWCIVINNTWAATVFLMFGGFWSSYGIVLCSFFGIADQYSSSAEYSQAVALYFTPWCLFVWLLFMCTWKSTWALSVLLFLVWFFILLFTIGTYISSVKVMKAGGFFCILSGIVGLYNCFAGMADDSNSYFTVKPMYLPSAIKPKKEE